MFVFNEKPKPNHLRIDLHGKSLEEARDIVKKAIVAAHANEKLTIEVITGRGNHPNSDGRRGLILKALPKWLEDPEIKPLIQFVQKKIGAYLIGLNRAIQDNKTLPSQIPRDFKELKEYKSSPPPNSISINHLKYSADNNALMTALSDENVDIKYIEELLNTQPSLLKQTKNDGTTVLMLAAAINRVDIMELIFFKRPLNGLLKLKRNDGYTTLMAAVTNEHIESINFLLKKSPSLLKKRCHNGLSVFQMVKKSERAKLILDTLYEHLKPHKREKGYTGLFREYREMIHEISVPKKKAGKVLMVESVAMKKWRKMHSWFYIDRMIHFLKYLKIPIQNISLIKRKIKQADNNGAKKLYIQRTLNNFIVMHSSLHHLFLKFNNHNKPKHKKRHKHEIQNQKYPFSPAKKGRAAIAIKGTKSKDSQKRKMLKKKKIRTQERSQVVKPLIFSNQKGWGMFPKFSSSPSNKTNIQEAQNLKGHKLKKKKRIHYGKVR